MVETTSLEEAHHFPRGTSVRASRVLRRLLKPLKRFSQMETAAGLVLLSVTAVALAWANSPWKGSYFAFWQQEIGLYMGAWRFQADLKFLVNDVLMTVFFFVIGLEIRREIARGELSQLRRAALPFVAALGGMAVPALLFLSLNWGLESQRGWGVPMATDIAFAVGALSLLGARVLPSLRILLLALAVIDDIGAIVVIALFYSSGLKLGALGVAFLGIAGVWLMQKSGVRRVWAYVLLGGLIWLGAHGAGIHPTLSGVILGLLTPVIAGYSPKKLTGLIHPHTQAFSAFSQHGEVAPHAASSASEVSAAVSTALKADMTEEVVVHVLSLEGYCREGISFVDRLVHRLHIPVAYFIMPLFALANAGVTLGGATLSGLGGRVFYGIVLGLVLGKPIGIVLACFMSTKLRIANMPTGADMGGITLVGGIAGIGFTMALFITELAFASTPFLETAKLAVLIASLVATLLSLTVGFFLLPGRRVP